MKRPAFTLAETLMVLVIIGVVSALSIPTLITNIGEGEYNTGVKQAYALLSQAVNKRQAEQQGFINVGTAAAGTTQTLFSTDICNALVCIKQATVADIFPATYSYYKSASSWTVTMTDKPAAVLSNGSYLYFFSYNACTSLGINACGFVNVDINGAKGPNMMGKDYFRFWIVFNNGVYSVIPVGSPGESSAYTCVAGSAVAGTSLGCTYTRLFTPDSMP